MCALVSIDPLAELTKARVHSAFTLELYMEQVSDGRFLPHEHPQAAASGYGDAAEDILEIEGADSAPVRRSGP